MNARRRERSSLALQVLDNLLNYLAQFAVEPDRVVTMHASDDVGAPGINKLD